MSYQRRPGDRILRRRVNSRQEIIPPPVEEAPRTPTVQYHARVFLGAFSLLVGIGALLLALPWTTRSGESTPLQDTLFTATSAASVTGLVTVDTYDHWNFLGQLIILLLIQIGGLGFMVSASIILRIMFRGYGSGLRGNMLIRDGAPAVTLNEAADLTRRIIRFTFVTEAIGAIALFLVFLRHGDATHIAIWRGIFTAISAFCNAGFDLQGNFQSMTEFHGAIFFNVVLMTLIQAGALSYIVLADVANQRNWRRLSVNSKMVLTANFVLILVAFSIYLGSEWNGSLSSVPYADRPLEALFQSISARTAGFSTVAFDEVSPLTDYTWIPIMGSGGASGSTAGGVKLGTVALMAATIISLFKGNTEVQAFKRRLPIELIMRSITLIALFILAHFAITGALAITEHTFGNDPEFITLLFESMSALATVGLSDGITTGLSVGGKLVLVVAMFIGRLGPLTVAYALQKPHVAQRYHLPPAKIYIG